MDEPVEFDITQMDMLIDNAIIARQVGQIKGLQDSLASEIKGRQDAIQELGELRMKLAKRDNELAEVLHPEFGSHWTEINALNEQIYNLRTALEHAQEYHTQWQEAIMELKKLRLQKAELNVAVSQLETKLSKVEKENFVLREALAELTGLMQGVIEGDYVPDSFTLQAAHKALGASA